MTTDTGAPTAAIAEGRRADSARRRQRVLQALNDAMNDGEEVSVSGIARRALLTELRQEFLQFSGSMAASGDTVPARDRRWRA